MKKIALVFLAAVFVPSLILAWLALRSLRDQQFLLERQQSLLYQGVTDSLVKEINDYLAEQQREFNAQVESLSAGSDPGAVAPDFDERLRQNWPLAEVGFCVTLSGNLLSPSPASRPEARLFCVDNGKFLANRESVEVYWNYLAKGGNVNIGLNAPPQPRAYSNSSQNQAAVAQSDTDSAQLLTQNPGKAQARKVMPAQQLAQVPSFKNASGEDVSTLVPAEAEFRQLIGDANDGMLARFVQNKLNLMFWHRLEKDPQLVFGAQLDLDRIIGIIRLMLHSKTKSMMTVSESITGIQNWMADSFPKLNRPAHVLPILPDEIGVVVLDDNAKPVAASDRASSFELADSDGTRVRNQFDNIFRELFKTDLKHPFVATEIGEALPHWEVAAYLRNPDGLKQTARTVQLTLGILILLLVLAIGVGSWLITRELKRQLILARQKTDFVSNVSHELKTPLTSIRMFSEMLAEGRVTQADKQRSYLNIITAETARLTRLINNVLDFSRLERGEKKYHFAPCDLAEVVRETAETFRPHLESNGFRLNYAAPNCSLFVNGDRDALAQVVVNLLSNAEKYSNGQKEIDLQVERHAGPPPTVEVRVADRGMGVPRGCEAKIFEQFYRAHDSLDSGIQGSGLGLTLARQIARAHGGEVTYEPRDGGGSCFALRLPLQNAPGA